MFELICTFRFLRDKFLPALQIFFFSHTISITKALYVENKRFSIKIRHVILRSDILKLTVYIWDLYFTKYKFEITRRRGSCF